MHVALQEPSKGVDAARSSFMSSKRSIEALTVQPDFLAGGQLRDYQLDGINWLTYAWIKVHMRCLPLLIPSCC
jgi:chromodomain-helicase-DNA-binding protein 1